MKRILLGLCLMIGVSAVGQTAQDTVWWVGGNTSLNFNQVSLTNWSAGGKNSVAGTFLFNTFFNYKKDRVNWDNVINLGYGLTKQGSENSYKTEDRLYISSKYGYENGGHWFYSALLDFKTQFDAGYSDPPENTNKISEFLAPGYMNLSLGMDYKPNDNFSLYISPLTSKFTFVMDDSLASVGAFGVDEGDNLRVEYGALVKLTAKKENIIKNVDLATRLDLFSNLTNKPQNVDVDWELILNMKVNEYLSAVASFNLIYDDDINYVDEANVEHGPRVQFKQLFGVGLAYKFGDRDPNAE